ncbi:hypothetical protein V6N12_045300 [Hibiscus sabdariffa]|uniref:Uncharacterized protein n=1 Tax=Hibiscus sabdariffa TaxID=183260 RepID=A0ABR2G2E8_9ROSI
MLATRELVSTPLEEEFLSSKAVVSLGKKDNNTRDNEALKEVTKGVGHIDTRCINVEGDSSMENPKSDSNLGIFGMSTSKVKGWLAETKHGSSQDLCLAGGFYFNWDQSKMRTRQIQIKTRIVNEGDSCMGMSLVDSFQNMELLLTVK